MLERLWRVAATGFCFAVFGVGGLLFSVVLPIVRLCSRTQYDKDRRARWLIHQAFRFFVGLMCAVGVIAVSIEERSLLRQADGKLLVANHPSLIDVVILISLVPKANCVVKQDLWRNPFMRGVVSATGYVSNNNSTGLIEACRDTMDAGFTLIVFPEGTRTKDFNNLKFQRGAANIAVRCEADVVPVTIDCEPPTLGKGTKWYQVPPRRAHYTITAHPVIGVTSVVNGNDEPAIATRKFNRYLLGYYEGKLAHG